MQIGESRNRPILVLGATGRQGGAVLRHLLRAGWPVRALVRGPNKPAAQDLRRQGAELIGGDFDDRDSLNEAMKGAYGVFSVQDPWQAGLDGEIRHGTNIAECAHAAGISHFVYSSAGSANRQTGVPHFETKARIEERIKLLELPYTIVRPVFFMENWEMIAGRSLRDGRIIQPLVPDKPLQQIAVDDIGAAVASIFEHPDDWIAHELEFAGDELTMLQVAETFSRLLNRRIEYVQIPLSEFRRTAGDELALMYEWFNEAGYQANIHYLNRMLPGLKTLAQFLKEQDWLKPYIGAGAGSGARGMQG